MNVIKSHVVCLTVFALAFVTVRQGYAQQTLVDVKIEVPEILIGQQTLLHLSVTTDKDKQLIIPLPNENLTDKVEVLQILPPDTIDIKNNRVTIKYDMVITAFDSTLCLLPPFIAIDGQDTIYSNQEALKVSNPDDVDYDNPDSFKDIKTVWKPPFVLSDYYALIYSILFILFLICVVGYFIQRMKKRPQTEEKVQEGPKLPPHEQAIKELNEIRERKLWQQGLSKEYYTAITDTLRRYISARYGISAMEKTSSEILEMMQSEEKHNKAVMNTLKQILQLSDYVKFAKLNPLPDENNLSMTNANIFVESTVPQLAEQPAETQADPQNYEATLKKQ